MSRYAISNLEQSNLNQLVEPLIHFINTTPIDIKQPDSAENINSNCKTENTDKPPQSTKKTKKT